MLRTPISLLAVAIALAATPAVADNYTINDASGVLHTFRSILFGGIDFPLHDIQGCTALGLTPICNPEYLGILNPSGGLAGLAGDSSGHIILGASTSVIGGVTQSGAWSFSLGGTLPPFATPPAFTLTGSLLPAFAAPPTVLAQTSPAHAEATPCSGTISSASSPQDLFAAGIAVNGFQIQNQSTGYLYIRSKGSAGTTTASVDQNSLRLDPDGYYEPPHLSAYGVSIEGATVGQAFYCRTF